MRSKIIRCFSRSLFFALAALLVITAGCGKKSKLNPYDPDDPDYQKPRVKNLSLADGTVFTSDTVAIAWQGNFPDCEFRFRFRKTDGWSAWAFDTAFTEIMADGAYYFEISVRYRDLSDTTITAAGFTVKTLTAPALFLYPRTSFIADTDTGATVVLKCTGLDTCNALKFEIDGALIRSARFADSLHAGSVVLFKDTVVNIIVGPADRMFYGDMALLSMVLKPLPGADTSFVEIVAPIAKMVCDTIQDSVDINQVKGGFIILRRVITK